MEDYLEIRVETTIEKEEELIDFLYDLGIDGVEVIAALTPQEIEEIDGDYLDLDYLDNSEGVTLKAYIKKSVFEANKDLIKYRKEEYVIKDITDHSYLTAYKEYFHTFRVGERFKIVPSWEDEDETDSGDLVLKLDPGTAFGTGTHETTQNILEIMEEIDFKNKRVVDVGTGSGILTIAALKLGAKYVLAVDNDENATRVARENIEYNELSEDRWNAETNNLLDEIPEKFDVIIANIVADIIISLSDDAWNSLEDKGYFLVSGIISEKWQDVRESVLDSGFKLEEKREDGGWVAASFRKKELTA